jgi:hypothetical protein
MIDSRADMQKKTSLREVRRPATELCGVGGVSTCVSLVASPGYFIRNTIRLIITGSGGDVKGDLDPDV